MQSIMSFEKVFETSEKVLKKNKKTMDSPFHKAKGKLERKHGSEGRFVPWSALLNASCRVFCRDAD